jgi:hypothetical protein
MEFKDGWVKPPLVVEQQGNATYVAFQANGTYTYFPLVINRTVESTPSYLLVSFRTNDVSSITVAANVGTLLYLSAINPPTTSLGNHYQSTSPYTTAYLLPSDPIQGIDLFVTNQLAPTFKGRLEVWIQSVSVVTDIGQPYDLLRRIPILTEVAAVVSPSDYKSYLSDVQPTVTSFSSLDISQTRYEARYSSPGPAILVLNEAFNSLWNAYVNGVRIMQHFGTNNFANGWLIPAGMNETIVISFDPQSYHEAGFAISVGFMIAILSFPLIQEVRNRKRRSRNGLRSESPSKVLLV